MMATVPPGLPFAQFQLSPHEGPWEHGGGDRRSVRGTVAVIGCSFRRWCGAVGGCGGA